MLMPRTASSIHFANTHNGIQYCLKFKPKLKSKSMGSFLPYVGEIGQDILHIIYLIFYGLFSFMTLPIRHYFLPVKLKKLDNDIILILGYPSPLTHGLCQKLHPIAGKVVVLTDLTHSECNELSMPTDTVHYSVCFNDRESLEDAIDRVEQEVGPPSIVINAIDCTNPGKLLDQSYTQTSNIVTANLTSNFWVARKVLPKMLEMNKGHFLMISNFPKISWGLTDCVPYIGSRCGVIGFMQSLQDSIKHHMGGADIKFTAVIPSFRMRGISEGGNKMANLSIRLPQITDSEFVEHIIRGIRRNKQNIYVPCSFGILLWFENFTPLEFMRKLQSYLIIDGLENSPR